MVPGSFEVAAADRNLVEQMRLADSLVPPTATYTPFPTSTPPPKVGPKA